MQQTHFRLCVVAAPLGKPPWPVSLPQNCTTHGINNGAHGVRFGLIGQQSVPKEEIRDFGARSWKAWVLINETSRARLRKMFSQHESASNTGRSRKKILCIPCGRTHENISNERYERNSTPYANKLSWEDLELPVMAVCNCYCWRLSWVLPLKETSLRPRRRPSS